MRFDVLTETEKQQQRISAKTATNLLGDDLISPPHATAFSFFLILITSHVLADRIYLSPHSYCVEAKYSQKFPELTFVGHRGPMGECAGDCDSNEDCMGDLICYQPTGSVPGCPGTSQDSDIDYCVDLKKLEMSGNYFNFVLQGDLEPGSLGRCQGDCDSDEGKTIGVATYHL